MKRKRTKKYVFEGLGFPVVLLNAPWRCVFGEWVLDVNFNELQKIVLLALIQKKRPLSGAELLFIRKYLEMTTTTFGNLLGVSHVAVVKWENNKSQINPATELCIRLHVMDLLPSNDKEFRKFFHEMSSENLAKHKKAVSEDKPIKINAEERLTA
jgi:DNA-binding transcriptional regulator YiaG